MHFRARRYPPERRHTFRSLSLSLDLVLSHVLVVQLQQHLQRSEVADVIRCCMNVCTAMPLRPVEHLLHTPTRNTPCTHIYPQIHTGYYNLRRPKLGELPASIHVVQHEPMPFMTKTISCRPISRNPQRAAVYATAGEVAVGVRSNVNLDLRIMYIVYYIHSYLYVGLESDTHMAAL